MKDAGTATTVRLEQGGDVRVSTTDERPVRLTVGGSGVDLTQREAVLLASALAHCANVNGGQA